MTTTHTAIYRFFNKLLPNEELLYHSPLPPTRHYDPLNTRFVASRIILSLTPTEGVYNALMKNYPNVRSVVFLHRPFRLDRRRVPHGTLVLASHARYDELLTTGWNEALADDHLILPSPDASTGQSTRICLQGYKNDPERRIGLVGLLTDVQITAQYAFRLSQAFGGHDALRIAGHEGTPSHSEEKNSVASGSEDSVSGTSSTTVKVLACLNAFNPEIIDRIVESAGQLGVPPNQVLCLTGAVRDAGVEAATAADMSFLAVGHKRCELWGMGYIQEKLRSEFREVEIIHVDEEEPPRDATKKVPRHRNVDTVDP